MTELEVLQQLDIPDFRHMTKDKVVNFASMLSEMDPGVAEKALEQFPEFSKTVLELAKEYKATIEKSLDTNLESTKACYSVCNAVIESIQKQLDNSNLSFEERKYYIEQMKEIAQIASQKDSENKTFLWKVLGVAAGATVVLGGIVVSALGGKINLKLPNNK